MRPPAWRTLDRSRKTRLRPSAEPMERRSLLSATPMDFDGDGKADFYVYDQPTATFDYALASSPNVARSFQLGDPTHANVVTLADYDGDGKTDFSVFDRNTSTFLVANSASGSLQSVANGDPSHAASIVPVPADYTGDHRADFAIYDKTGAIFYVKPSSNPNTAISMPLGDATHVNSITPLPADYTGDGAADYAIFDSTGSIYYVRPSNNPSAAISVAIGDPTHVNSITPLPADYNGDGAADFAIFDRTGSIYYVKPSSNVNTFSAVAIGDPTHVNSIVPVPADYNGDGAADYAIFDKTGSIYYVKPSGNPNTFTAVAIGDPTHVASITPVPADYTGDGAADFAIYDGTGAVFYSRTSRNLGAVITSYVGGRSQVYEPIGGAKADINGSSSNDPLILYNHTTSTFISPVIPPTIAGQAPRPNTLQFGDPSHDNVPVINANTSINGSLTSNPLILYDRTTSTFIAPPLSAGLIGLPPRANTLQFGDPSHDNVPIVSANIDLNGDGKADPLILYDRTTSTFIAPILANTLGGAKPPPNTLQFGDPSHDNVPIVNANVSINGSATKNALMLYDRTTSTFIAPPLASNVAGKPPRPNTLQLGDPTHTNIPVLNAAANLNGDQSTDPLIVFDQTTSTFISPVIPSGVAGVPSLPNTFALGDSSHLTVPIVNSGANLNGDTLADPLIVYDPIGSTFFSPLLPITTDQPRPFYLQLGDPTHRNVPIPASGANINSASTSNPLIVYDPIASMFIAPPLTNLPPGKATPPYTLTIGVISPGARQSLPTRRFLYSQTT